MKSRCIAFPHTSCANSTHVTCKQYIRHIQILQGTCSKTANGLQQDCKGLAPKASIDIIEGYLLLNVGM